MFLLLFLPDFSSFFSGCVSFFDHFLASGVALLDSAQNFTSNAPKILVEKIECVCFFS